MKKLKKVNFKKQNNKFSFFYYHNTKLYQNYMSNFLLHLMHMNNYKYLYLMDRLFQCIVSNLSVNIMNMTKMNNLNSELPNLF